MLKTIAEVSPELVDFIEALGLPLSKPQKRHITQVADALITAEGNKTLSGFWSFADLIEKTRNSSYD